MNLRPDQSVQALNNVPEGAIEKTTFVVSGTAAGLNNLYFLFSSSGVNYYCWYNYNSTGVDPAVASRTAVPVAVGVGAALATIATNTAAAIDALALVNSQADGVNVKIQGDAINPLTDAAAGTSGFSFSIDGQGKAAQVGQIYPNQSVGSLLVTPNAVV